MGAVVSLTAPFLRRRSPKEILEYVFRQVVNFKKLNPDVGAASEFGANGTVLAASCLGCLVVWLSGCLVVWLSGCLVVWLSGCLGCLVVWIPQPAVAHELLSPMAGCVANALFAMRMISF